jgi:hypothetical protein
MNKTILVVVTGLLMAGCNKDDMRQSYVTIKGKIPAAGTTKSQALNTYNSLSLNDAKKILVFNGLDDEGTLLSCSLVDITDGSFTASADMGNAAALVFLDADNKYIGTLSTQGLNLLPLGKLTDGEDTTIDLSSLSLSGNYVLPSYNPFGNEIVISEDEINILKEIDGFFGSLAKNIDADNDGILDMLNDKQIYIRTQFQFIAGRYGLNNNPPVISDSALNFINYNFFVFGGKGFTSPGSISLSGPQGSPYSDIGRQFFSTALNGCGFGSCFWREAFVGSGSPTGIGLLPFKSGTYTVTIDNIAYTLDYSLIDLRYNLLFVLPTLHTNSDGKLVSLSLEYRLPDNTIIDNPENILTDVGIQLTGENLNYDSPHLTNQPAETLASNRVHGLFSVDLDSPVDISKLHHVTLTYNDLLGNTYMLEYRNN